MAQLIINQDVTLRNYLESISFKIQCAPVEVFRNHTDGADAL